MGYRSAPRKRFLARAFVFGFLCLLALIPSGHKAAGRHEPAHVIVQRDLLTFATSASMMAEPMKIGAPSDVSVAFEDSDELFRLEIQQRAVGIDRAMIEPKLASRAAPKRQPKISPPLLV